MQNSDDPKPTLKVVSLLIKDERSAESPDFDQSEADVHLFTEPHRTDDPCERFKTKLEQMKKKHKHSKIDHAK